MGIGLGLSTTLRAVDTTIPQLSEFKDGRWQIVEGPSTQPAEVQSDPQIDEIERIIEQGRYSEAKTRLIAWLKFSRGSPVRDRALYLMAVAQDGLGDHIKAFYYLDEMLDDYPESPLFYTALNRQYDIADRFLNGTKRKVLFFSIGAEDEAVEMLFRVQQRSPGSELAEKALLRTADYYYADSQFDLAADAYASYLRSFPRSPLTSRVKLRQAYSNLAQFRGLKFDPTPVIDARTQLLDLSAQFPEVAQAENIQSLLDRIDATFAKKLYRDGTVLCAHQAAPSSGVCVYVSGECLSRFTGSVSRQGSVVAPPAAPDSAAGADDGSDCQRVLTRIFNH